jgi:glycosyltransferase involved in cell wall biosynthesis
MNLDQLQKICLVPHQSGVGGMVSFQEKFLAGMNKRGISVTQDLSENNCQAVLVIGGTRNLIGLWNARKRGIPIIQRLDGMNWFHRVRLPNGKLRTGWRHYIRAEYGNWNLSTIRKRIATKIIYQSKFTKDWWEGKYGTLSKPNWTIYNGVDLERFSPSKQLETPKDRYRILMVEGSLLGGYEQGLEAVFEMIHHLLHLMGEDKKRIELMIIGKVGEATRYFYEQGLRQKELDCSLNWVGVVPHEKIPQFDRTAHLLYSSDLNAACPNSVIEALACGLPVVSFDTGALPEIVTENAGVITPYGGDSWKLEKPDTNALAKGAMEILIQQPKYRQGARRRAEESFGLETMIDAYINVLLDG